MPKKPPPNAFYFFMKEMQADLAAKGAIVSMKDMSEHAGPSWKQKSKAERAPYEQAAAEAKHRLKQHKLTNDGIAIELVQKMEKKEEEFKNKMLQEIADTIKIAGEAVDDVVFYLMHVNTFCRVASKRYYPAEIAVARFSLRNGIARKSDVYHSFCKPGSLPLGYAFTVKQTANETHQIEYPEEEVSNIEEIVMHLIKFLKFGLIEKDTLPPVYTFGKNYTICSEIMKMFCHDFGYKEHYIKVYRLEWLFLNLRNSICVINDQDVVFPSVSNAILELEKDIYYFTKGIGCEFHDNSDVPNHCSRSFVIRWAYVICDNCCPDWHIPLIPGQHVPQCALIKAVSSPSTPTCSSSVKSLQIQIRKKNPYPTISGSDFDKDKFLHTFVSVNDTQYAEDSDSMSTVTLSNISTRLSDVTLIDEEGLDDEKLGPGAYGSEEVSARDLVFASCYGDSGRASCASSTTNDDAASQLSSQLSASTTSTTVPLRRPYSLSAGIIPGLSRTGSPSVSNTSSHVDSCVQSVAGAGINPGLVRAVSLNDSDSNISSYLDSFLKSRAAAGIYPGLVHTTSPNDSDSNISSYMDSYLRPDTAAGINPGLVRAVSTSNDSDSTISNYEDSYVQSGAAAVINPGLIHDGSPNESDSNISSYLDSFVQSGAVAGIHPGLVHARSPNDSDSNISSYMDSYLRPDTAAGINPGLVCAVSPNDSDSTISNYEDSYVQSGTAAAAIRTSLVCAESPNDSDSNISSHVDSCIQSGTGTKLKCD